MAALGQVAFAGHSMLGLCTLLLINSHSLKQSPYPLRTPWTTTTHLSRHFSHQVAFIALIAFIIAIAEPKPVVRPSGDSREARVGGLRTHLHLGPRKFQQRRLSVPPTLNLAFTSDLQTPRLTTRASRKTRSTSTDCTFMPSIALWSHRFGRLCQHEQYVFPSTS
jgi:hypothetical protein